MGAAARRGAPDPRAGEAQTRPGDSARLLCLRRIGDPPSLDNVRGCAPPGATRFAAHAVIVEADDHYGGEPPTGGGLIGRLPARSPARGPAPAAPGRPRSRGTPARPPR